MSRGHRELDSWQKGREFVARLCRATDLFPADERFGLTAQLRRAAVSVPSNIAGGAARSTTADYLRFLYMARGSPSEIDTQITLAGDLEFLTPPQCQSLLEDVDNLARLLQGQINGLKGANQTDPTT